MSDITELFARDPLEFSQADLDAIIDEMRKKRVLFNSAPTAKAAPKKLTAGQEKAAKLSLDIKL
jgi:hypothetical protein